LTLQASLNSSVLEYLNDILFRTRNDLHQTTSAARVLKQRYTRIVEKRLKRMRAYQSSYDASMHAMRLESDLADMCGSIGSVGIPLLSHCRRNICVFLKGDERAMSATLKQPRHCLSYLAWLASGSHSAAILTLQSCLKPRSYTALTLCRLEEVHSKA
jgi:hypothetical protein